MYYSYVFKENKIFFDSFLCFDAKEMILFPTHDLYYSTYLSFFYFFHNPGSDILFPY